MKPPGATAALLLGAALVAAEALTATGLARQQPDAIDADGDLEPAPTPLEVVARSAAVASLRAGAATGDATAAAAGVGARFAAEAAAVSAKSAGASAERAKRDRLALARAVTEAQQSQAGAAAAARAAESAFRRGEALAASTEGIAASRVRGSVTGELADVYKGLQEWKMEVLHNPVEEARAAGAHAALPYQKAMRETMSQAGGYVQRADAVGEEAFGLRSQAVGLANSAVVMQAAGNAAGASQGMEAARSAMGRAAKLEEQGLELQRAAEKLAAKIPAYSVAAQHAAQAAFYRVTSAAGDVIVGPPPPTAVPLPQPPAA